MNWENKKWSDECFLIDFQCLALSLHWLACLPNFRGIELKSVWKKTRGRGEWMAFPLFWTVTKFCPLICWSDQPSLVPDLLLNHIEPINLSRETSLFCFTFALFSNVTQSAELSNGIQMQAANSALTYLTIVQIISICQMPFFALFRCVFLSSSIVTTFINNSKLIIFVSSPVALSAIGRRKKQWHGRKAILESRWSHF